MTRALRSELYAADEVGVYHCWNRIVRRSFLCGFDPVSKKDYSHRRGWLHKKMKHLAKYFAIDVLAYAILSNHYHIVLRNRPDLVSAMSDREVVIAWLTICTSGRKKKTTKGKSVSRPDILLDEENRKPLTESQILHEMSKVNRVRELRSRLSNPSWFNRQLAQYMGIRCNLEDEITGHFWESRFQMSKLVDEEAVLACMAYVDLNPIRAGLAVDLEGYEHVSIRERLRTLDDEAVDSSGWLTPLEIRSQVDGRCVAVVNHMTRQEIQAHLAEQAAERRGCFPIRRSDYVELLRYLAGVDKKCVDPSTESRGFEVLKEMGFEPAEFAETVLEFRKSFGVLVGCSASLARECASRPHLRPKLSQGNGLERSQVRSV